jgi:lactoylglutathione lyase
MPAFSADHFAFGVSDLDASIEFYTRKIGLKLLFKESDDNHHEAFAFLELNGRNLELLQSLDENNQPVPRIKQEIVEPYCPHLAIGTDDLDGVLSSMKEKQVPVIKGPLEIPGKVRWVYFADPDNNILEFVEWL